MTLCPCLCFLCLLLALIATHDVMSVFLFFFNQVRRHSHLFLVLKQAAVFQPSVTMSPSSLAIDGFVTMVPLRVLT